MHHLHRARSIVLTRARDDFQPSVRVRPIARLLPSSDRSSFPSPRVVATTRARARGKLSIFHPPPFIPRRETHLSTVSRERAFDAVTTDDET